MLHHEPIYQTIRNMVCRNGIGMNAAVPYGKETHDEVPGVNERCFGFALHGEKTPKF